MTAPPQRDQGGRPELSVRLTGKDVTKEMATETGEQMLELLDVVAEAKGLPTGLFKATGVQIACDSCDARRAWDDEGHGWVRTADGLDYCPACIVAGPRRDA